MASLYGVTSNNSTMNCATLLVNSGMVIGGNVTAANAYQGGNLFASLANVSTAVQTPVLVAGASVGIGSESAATLTVQGNIFASNALTTGPLLVTNVNASSSNTLTLLTTKIGTGGETMNISGNVWISNSLSVMNISGSRMNTTTTNLLSISGRQGRVGIGTLVGLAGPILNVLGNIYASNSLSTTNIQASKATTTTMNLATMNITGNLFTTAFSNAFLNTNTINVLSIEAQVGIGTSTNLGATLQVQGNIYAPNSLSTTNIQTSTAVAATMNIVTANIIGGLFVPSYTFTTINTTTTNLLTIQSQSGQVGVGTSTSLGATLQVLGNIYASNSLSTTNVQTSTASYTTMNTVTANISGSVFTPSYTLPTINTTTTNVLAFWGPVGQVGVGTSTNLGATLQVQGNVAASNSISTTSVQASTASSTTMNTATANINSAVGTSYVAATVNTNTTNVLSISGQVGVGTSTNLGATLQVLGNIYVSNSLSTTSVQTSTASSTTMNTATANITGNLVTISYSGATVNATSTNVLSFYGQSGPVGIGTSTNLGATLQVQGNVAASNSISTTNVQASTAVVATMNTATANIVNSYVSVSVNTTTTNVLSISGQVGVGTSTNLGATLQVLGNIYASNSLSTTNIQTSTASSATMNTATANITGNIVTISYSGATLNAITTNVLSISGQVGVGTSTNLGATLQVQGNVAVSNEIQTTNITATRTIFYNEDLTKRSIHLLPTPSNASAIQSWISATCNASARPSQSYWSTSPQSVYGNVVTGPAGNSDYAGSVLLGDGRVLFVPYNASNIGIFNPFNNQFTSVSPSGLSTAAAKFKGGVLLPNGNVVFTPSGQSNIGMFNPMTGIYSNISFGYSGSTPFSGCVLAPSGNVVFVPYSSANIAVFNPTARTSTNVGPIFGINGSNFSGGQLLPNGNIIFTPSFSGNIGVYNSYSLLTSAYSNVGSVKASGSSITMDGACITPNGNIVFTPTTVLGNIIVYNPTVGIWSNVTHRVGGTQPFIGGGILLPSGNIVFTPGNSSNIGMFDPVALAYSNSTFVGSGGGFGGRLIPDGRIVMTPYGLANVGVLDTLTPAPVEFCLSPYFNKF